MNVRVGTRGSALAMTQARDISRRLTALGQEPEIVVIKTEGDADQVRPFVQVGAPGLFVRAIEEALGDDRIDVAVHCYKDLPSVSPDGLCIAAMPEREDARDRLLVAPESHDPEAEGLPLRAGTLVGTASARRQALVRHLRPDLELALLRGNVPTRVDKLRAGDFGAILLATAGLRRLARAAELGEGAGPTRTGLIEIDLDPTSFVPAPSQGALALQVRAADETTRAAVAELDDAVAHRAVRAERALLAQVEAGCQVPFGAWCRSLGGERLELFAALEVAGELREIHETGDEPEALAAAVFERLLPEGSLEP